MNPNMPTIPSVVGLKASDLASILPPLPQIQSMAFARGGVTGDPGFRPNVGLMSDLRSRLASGDLTFDQAASMLKESGGNQAQGVNPEDLKKSLVQSFGGQSFQGPEGQVGYFNDKNYGFIPQTVKNVKSVVTGMGATRTTRALPQGYGKL